MKIVIRKLSKPGCQPCAAISHYLESMTDMLAEAEAEVISHDIAEEPELIDKYGVTGVPVLIYERNGVEVTRLTGLVSSIEIVDAIQYAKEAR